jgi:hypothetical protein
LTKRILALINVGILVAIITEKVKSRVAASKMLTRSSGGFKPEKQRVDHLCMQL